ncbi:chorismate mutase [Atopobacter sp. AH10]|uniref:chorismate mutase n=1 Tax=Atopobacter sp. AH10 TaxID=2315861 RepID=UPI001314231B|nr:chorismate mutase [Atopobacter sp. AH10]
MSQLEQLRDEINLLDQKILKLLEERFQLSSDVADYKHSHHLPIYQANREEEILEKVTQQLHNKALSPAVEEVWLSIFSASRKLQEHRQKEQL